MTEETERSSSSSCQLLYESSSRLALNENLMPFSDFAGNPRNHPPPAGDARPRPLSARRDSCRRNGSGKYTLALMLARAMNCLERTTGQRRLAGFLRHSARTAHASRNLQDLDARFAEAVEARENLRDTDKKETRLFVQTHPDVLIIPPDPPQMMIKVDQVRHVIETIYYRPGEGRERVYIFTGSAFMKEAANSLLKVLEEPPDFATIFLLTENAGELLPTIRSRSMIFNLGALSFARDRERSPSFVPIGMNGSALWWRGSVGARWDARYLSILKPMSPPGATRLSSCLPSAAAVPVRSHSNCSRRPKPTAPERTGAPKSTVFFARLIPCSKT